MSIDTDSSGNVYIAYTQTAGECRLTKLSNTGALVYDRTFDGEFYNTFDIHALDSGEVYIIDSQYQEIIKFTDTGAIAWSRYLQEPSGAATGPMFCAVDKSSGEIFITLTYATQLPTGSMIFVMNSSGALTGSQKYAFADAATASKIVIPAAIEIDSTHIYHISWLNTAGVGPVYVTKIPRNLGAYVFSAVVDVTGVNEIKGSIISSAVSSNEISIVLDDTYVMSVLSFPKNGVFDSGTVLGNTWFSINTGGAITNSAITVTPVVVNTTANFSSVTATVAFNPTAATSDLSIGSISSLFTSITGTF